MDGTPDNSVAKNLWFWDSEFPFTGASCLESYECEWMALIKVGSIPDAIASCISINGIILKGNQLAGTIPGCVSMIQKYVASIALAQNKLSGTIPSALASFASMQTLWLEQNELSA